MYKRGLGWNECICSIARWVDGVKTDWNSILSITRSNMWWKMINSIIDRDQDQGRKIINVKLEQKCGWRRNSLLQQVSGISSFSLSEVGLISLRVFHYYYSPRWKLFADHMTFVMQTFPFFQVTIFLLDSGASCIEHTTKSMCKILNFDDCLWLMNNIQGLLSDS